jgi:drug/metabolite transporter (DMT)-like permease
MTSHQPRARIPLTARWGVGLALATALISGFSIFVNATAVRFVPDPALFTTLKNAVAAAILLVVAAATVPAAEVRALRPRSWGALAVVAVIGGSVPFLLFFTGLAAASAPSAAFIHKTLFVWVALLAVPFLGERLGWLQIGALGVLLGGQAIATPPAGIAWGAGETLIAIATLLWAVEAVLVRRLVAGIPSPVLAAARLGLGLVVLVGYLLMTGRLAGVTALGAEAWGWVLVTGVLLSGYVGTWYAALRRAPAAVVTSVLVIGAPITAVLQALSTGNVPAAPVVGGYVLVTVAVLAVALLALLRRGSNGAAVDGAAA